jgi:anti-sigma factor RsiW
VTPCQELELLISLRATGDLDEADAKRVEVHLAACASCRAEAEQAAAALGLARLPAPTDADRRATAGLARETLAELHRREGRASSWKRALAGFAAAAAVLVAVLAPAMLGRRTAFPPSGLAGGDQGAATATSAATASTATWEPDLDTVWSDTAILDDDASLSAADASDAALASLDL